MKLFNRNRNGHQSLEKWYMRIYGSVNALKHINNLSDKQRPVFEELEEHMDKFEASFEKHKNETSHYDIYDTAWLVTKWVSGVFIFIAATYNIWKGMI